MLTPSGNNGRGVLFYELKETKRRLDDEQLLDNKDQLSFPSNIQKDDVHLFKDAVGDSSFGPSYSWLFTVTALSSLSWQIYVGGAGASAGSSVAIAGTVGVESAVGVASMNTTLGRVA